MELNKLFITALTLVALVGCGGSGSDASGKNSGYDGSKSAATVNEDNKGDIVIAASIGAQKSIESSTAPRALGSHSEDPIEYILQQTSSAITSQGQLRVINRAYYNLSSTVCNGGGTAGYNYDENNTSGYGSFSISYNNCKYSYGGESTTIDGTATWVINQDNSYYYAYDLTVSYGGEVYRITATLECDSEYNCSYTDDFSYSGVSYRVADVSVSGSSSSGFNVSATVYHESLGYVEIGATGLIMCDNGGFSSGNITVQDSSNTEVLSITFDSCTSMTVEYDGVATTVSQ